MTPAEFKAWFEGFTEALSGVPTKAQWARIKARVSEIDGNPVTERFFIDRYWPTYVPAPYPYWRYPTTFTTFTVSNTAGLGSVGINATSEWKSPENMESFNSTDAMFALGKADFISLTSGSPS